MDHPVRPGREHELDPDRAQRGQPAHAPTGRVGQIAATLDLISGGRVELGLGAGAFWDAIEAAGGARRRPKEAVDALIEAITLIREFWQGGTLRFDGQHYRAHGLHAGPAHQIPIWLGAYGPRMLRVTGRLADGWVPSMGYADPPVLPELNAKLDDAAVAAGAARNRSAGSTTCSVGSAPTAGSSRGTPANWAGQLAGLAVETMSTFILGTDDPDTLRRLADEHEVIAGVLDSLDRPLVAVVTGDYTGEAGRTALTGLQEQVDVLTDTMLSHLAYEERELIGPLARHGFV